MQIYHSHMLRAGGPKRIRTRYSRIAFTLNNWTPQELVSLQKMPCTWMVLGKEIGENATPHIQGAAVLGCQKDLSSLKKIPGLHRAHIEPMMGNVQQNLDYCSKQDKTPFVKGKIPEPGKRTDLDEAVDDIRNGANLSDLAENHGTVVVKYFKGLMVLRSLLTDARTEPPKVIWVHGPTGVGKTRSCTAFADRHMGGSLYTSGGDLKWFDGYDGQRVALIDDFRRKHCTFPFLLRLLDRYPILVPFKGGFVNWTPTVIFITCPDSPENLFEVRGKFLPSDLAQLMRRINLVLHLVEDEVYDVDNVVEEIRTEVFGPLSPPPSEEFSQDSELNVMMEELSAAEEERDAIVADMNKLG